MIESIYRLNNVVGEPPLNAGAAVLEMINRPDDPTAQLTVSNNRWDFGVTHVAIINQHLADGRINEGLPFSIAIKENNSELLIFDGYLLLNDADVLFACDTITNVPSQSFRSPSQFSKAAKSIMFKDLHDRGVINSTSDVVQVPYVISTIPNYKEAAIVTITTFIVISQIRDMIKEVGKVSADDTNPLTAISGVVKTVIIIAWIIILIASIIILMRQITNLLIQPIKFHAAMLWRRSLEIGCAEMGYTLVSTIFDDEFVKNSVIMPPKPRSFEPQGTLDSLGFTRPTPAIQTGYWHLDFFELLKATKDVFRATITPTLDGRLIIEPVDSELLSASVTLPNIKRLTHKTNASKIIANYQINFQTDASDGNTRDDYFGVQTNAITKVKHINKKRALIIGGGENEDPEKVVSFPFARGKRKTELTSIEKRLDRMYNDHRIVIKVLVVVVNVVIRIRNAIIKVINKLIKAIRLIIKLKLELKPVPLIKIPSADSIKKRIGYLLLTDDYTDVPKLIALNINSDPRNTSIRLDNAEKWGTPHVYDKYHSGQSFVPTVLKPFGNQKRIFEGESFTGICKDDLESIQDNKRIFTSDGIHARVISFKWRLSNAVTESITYSIDEIHTDNLEIKTVTDDGF